MANRIQIRRDTAANWSSANPTLAQGEPGYEIDTRKLKVGDGSSDWNTLEYYSITSIQDYLDTVEGQPDGLATLDGAGKIPAGQIPSIALSETFVVTDITARDALTVEEGDVAIVTDGDGNGSTLTFIFDGSSWLEIVTNYLVKSVNGETGDVSLSVDDLTDVDTSSSPPSTSQALVWDGSNWVPQTVAVSGDDANIVLASQVFS